MKLHMKVAAWVLPLVLTGCVHKANQAKNPPALAPQIEDTPPPKPDNPPITLPQPVVTVPDTPPPPSVTPAPAKPAPKPAPKHKKPAPKPSQPQVASSGAPEVSAIGHLSSGDAGDVKQQTADSIASTERGLRDINRKLNDQEQKTSTQIREFLKQARTALASGDVDGARTLALKAKVLLGELNH